MLYNNFYKVLFSEFFMNRKNLSDLGIVYGSVNEVKAWHSGMKEPTTISKISTLPERSSGHINCLTYGGGVLYDAGYSGGIRETLSGRKVSKMKMIFGLGSYKGKLVALGQVEDPNVVYLQDINEKRSIAVFWNSKKFDHRPDSLSLAITDDDKVYVASQNVVELGINEETQLPKIKKITNYLDDFTLLVSSGKSVYSLSDHNPDTHPQGLEIRAVPSNKRIAFWKPTDDWNDLREPAYGYPRMAALFGRTLIVGSENPDTGESNIYSIDLTEEMIESKDGIRAEPQLLIKNAFDSEFGPYGKGNPMIAISRENLECILSKV